MGTGNTHTLISGSNLTGTSVLPNADSPTRRSAREPGRYEIAGDKEGAQVLLLRVAAVGLDE
jgi:hypothetical protein